MKLESTLQRENNYLKAIVIIALYFLLLSAEFLLAYIAAPSISMVANPLITLFGFEWLDIILIGAATGIIYIPAVCYMFIWKKRPIIERLDFKHFIAHLWGKPQMLDSVLALSCYMVIWILPILRIIVIIDWLVFLVWSTNISTLYHNMVGIYFLNLHGINIVSISAALILSPVFAMIWYYHEYRKNISN